MMQTEKLDGRRLRSEQSREAIIDAMLDLLREGHPRPGAQEIASRAGVSLRSVFRHFEDLDALYTEVSDRQKERIGHLFEMPPVAGPLRARIGALVEQRARLYEEVAPMRRAAVRLAPFHEPIRLRLGESHVYLRQHLPEVFAREMENLAPADRREVLDALEAVTSWNHWETLRADQKLSIERAKRVVSRTVQALLR